MISIELKDIRLHANHGIYEGEDKTGNGYHIDLSVKYDESNTDFTSLANTINYVELYDILKQRMQSRSGLLEKLCAGVIQQIYLRFPFISEVTISVYKIQAPIENFEGKVGVTLHKMFNV